MSSTPGKPALPKATGPDKFFHPEDPALRGAVERMRLQTIENIERETRKDFINLLGSHRNHYTKIASRVESTGRQAGWDSTMIANKAKADAVTGASDDVIEAQLNAVLSNAGEVEITGGVPPVTQNVRVNINYPARKNVWSGMKTVEQIFNAIRTKNTAELINEYGIEMDDGSGAALMDDQLHFAHDDQARALAQRIYIVTLSDTLRAGGVSAMNVAMAMKYLKEDPSIADVLTVKESKDAEKSAKDKLRKEVQKLEAMTIPGTDYDVLEDNFNTEMGEARTGPDRESRIDAQRRANSLKAEMDKYLIFSRQLINIHRQFGKVASIGRPTSGDFFDMADTGTVVLRDMKSANTPKKLFDELDDYLEEKMPVDKTPAPAAGAEKAEAPVGPVAVMRIFEAHINRRTTLAAKSREAAVLMFEENQKSHDYVHKMQHDVEHLFQHANGGKRSSPGERVLNEVKSYARGFLKPSAEAIICKIAEEVGVLKGSGTSGLSAPKQALKWVGIPLAAASMVGLGPLALGATAAAGTSYIGWQFYQRLWRGKPPSKGTKLLKFLQVPAYHARPEWGQIAGNLPALRIAWDRLQAKVKSKELPDTEYVRGELNTVRTLVQEAENYETAMALAGTTLTPAQEKALGNQNYQLKKFKSMGKISNLGYSEGEQADDIAPQVAHGIEHVDHSVAELGWKRRAMKNVAAKAPGTLWNASAKGPRKFWKWLTEAS